MSAIKQTVRPLQAIAWAVPWKIVSIAATTGVFFFLTPRMVTTLGAFQYGLYTLGNTILGYIALSEFGMASAIERELSLALGKKARRQYAAVLAEGIRLFCIIGAISLVATVVVTVFIFFLQQVLLAQIVAVLGAGLAIAFVFQPLYAILNAHLRFSVVTAFSVLQTLLWAGTLYILLLQGAGVLPLAIASVCVLLLVRLLLLTYVILRYGISAKMSRSRRQVFRQLLTYSGKTFLVRLAGLLQSKVDDFIIAGKLGVATITPYGIAAEMNSRANGILIFIMEMLNPVFSRTVGEKTRDKMHRLFRSSWVVAMLLSLGVCSTFWWLGPGFLRLWLPQQPVFLPLMILGVGWLLQRSQAPAETLFFAHNTHQQYAYMMLAEGLLNVFFSLLFVWCGLGLSGVALGTLAAMLIGRLGVQPVLAARVLQVSLGWYWWFYLSRMSVIGLGYWLVYMLVVPRVALNGYLDFLWPLGAAGLWGVVCLAVIFRREYVR